MFFTTTIETTTNVSVSILILVALIVSYMLEALMGGIADLFNRSFWKERIRKESDLTKKKKNDISYVYDFIKFHRPDIGGHLAKLSAECHMCRAMMVGSLILIIVYAIATPLAYSDALFWIIESGLLVVGISAFCLNRHILSRSREMMANNWRLINKYML